KDRALPDFCIVGPAKSGTSDLAVTIMAHPNVLSPLVKEVPSTDPLSWRPFYPTRQAVQRHAMRHGVALCPLVGPYLHSLDIPFALSSICPDTKIVITLRNPADLMFSQWKWLVLHKEKHLVHRVPFLESFSAYVNKLLELHSEAPGPFVATLLIGIYASSVAHWIRAFGAQNVRVVDAAAYFESRNIFFNSLEQFLGLPHVSLPERLPVTNCNPLKAMAPDPETLAKLRAFYAPYNQRLWEIIGTTFPW